MIDSSEVKVTKLSHAVADRLRQQMLNGSRKSGESLPSETELLTQFKVSRPTLREALRILEVEGMISLSRGMRSATVQGPTIGRAAEYAAMVLMAGNTNLNDLHEVRLLLEPSLVATLARQKNTRLINSLAAQLERMVASVAEGNYGAALATSNEFHSELARGQSNGALSLVIEILNALARDNINVMIEGFDMGRPTVRKNMEKTIAGYQRLLDLIRQGDANGAEKFWRGYMERARDVLRTSGLGARKVQHRPVSL